MSSHTAVADLLREQNTNIPVTNLVRQDVLRALAVVPTWADLVVQNTSLPVEDWLVAVRTLAASRSGGSWVRWDPDAPMITDWERLAALLDETDLGFKYVRALVSKSPLGWIGSSPVASREVSARLRTEEGRLRLLRTISPVDVATNPDLVELGLRHRPGPVVEKLPAVPESTLSTGALEDLLRNPPEALSNSNASAETSYALPHPHRWALVQDGVLEQILEFRPDVAERLEDADEWLPVLARTSLWRDEFVARGLAQVRGHLMHTNTRKGKFRTWHPAAFMSSMILHHATSAESRRDLLEFWHSSDMEGRSATFSPRVKKMLSGLTEDPLGKSTPERLDWMIRHAPKRVSRFVGLRLRFLEQVARKNSSAMCSYVARGNLELAAGSEERGSPQCTQFKDWTQVGFKELQLGMKAPAFSPQTVSRHWNAPSEDSDALVDVIPRFESALVNASTEDAVFAWQVLLDMEVPPRADFEELVDTALAVAGLG